MNKNTKYITAFKEKCGEWFKDFHPNNIKLMDSYLDSTLDQVRREEKNKYNSIFSWLFGETDFPLRKESEGAYWWRKELRRKLAELQEGKSK